MTWDVLGFLGHLGTQQFTSNINEVLLYCLVMPESSF